MWPSPTSFLSSSWRGGLLASGPGRGYSFNTRETKRPIFELETSTEDPPSFFFFFCSSGSPPGQAFTGKWARGTQKAMKILCLVSIVPMMSRSPWDDLMACLCVCMCCSSRICFKILKGKCSVQRQGLCYFLALHNFCTNPVSLSLK